MSIPSHIHRIALFDRYELRLIPRINQNQLKLRDIKSSKIGALVQMKGIVTRVTDVQPMMGMMSTEIGKLEERNTLMKC